jgi:hypothetical protein
MSDLLNLYQRGALTIALRAFEEQLRQCDEWMQGRTEEGMLYQRQFFLSRESRTLVREQITQALACIADLAGRFGLPVQEEDAVAMLRAGFSASWAALCDVRADKLKRYGQVAPGLAQALEPSIETLIELSLSLTRTLSDGADE